MMMLETENGAVIIPLDGKPIKTLESGAYNVYVKEDRIHLVRTLLSTPPKKVFGEQQRRRNAVLAKEITPGHDSLSAMFIGGKGCGKSATAETLIAHCISKDYVTFVIQTPLSVGILNALRSTAEKVVYYFTEFEKTYVKKSSEHPDQHDLLEWLSSHSVKETVLLFTANDDNNIVDEINNRPTRIKYWMEYEDVAIPTAMEILNEYNITGKLNTFLQAAFADCSVDEALCVSKLMEGKDAVKDLTLLEDINVTVANAIRIESSSMLNDSMDRLKELYPSYFETKFSFDHRNLTMYVTVKDINNDDLATGQGELLPSEQEDVVLVAIDGTSVILPIPIQIGITSKYKDVVAVTVRNKITTSSQKDDDDTRRRKAKIVYDGLSMSSISVT